MSKRKQAVRFLMVAMHMDVPNRKDEPFDMLLPIKSIKQIRVFKRNDGYNVEAYTVSDYAYYVWTSHNTREDADESLISLQDYINGDCE